MTNSYEASIAFPIRIGEWTLFEPQLNLQVIQQGIFESPFDHVADTIASLPSEVAGLMVGTGANANEQARALSFDSGMIRFERQRSQRCYVSLDGTFDDYLGGFSAKTRSGLKRKIRRLEKEADGDLRFKSYTAEDFDEFFDGARAVSAVTYQERMFDAGLPATDTDAQELKGKLRGGNARAYLLWFKEEPVAYLYCPIRAGVLAYQYVGFKAAYREFSPGTVLLLLALESLFGEGIFRAFDFTEGAGESSHKQFYGTASIEYVTVCWLRPTFRNLLVVTSQIGTRVLSGAVGFILDKLGLKRRVRRLMRAARGLG